MPTSSMRRSAGSGSAAARRSPIARAASTARLAFRFAWSPNRSSPRPPSGGRSLAEFALEARIPTGFFDGAVSVVPFVDAGTVSTSTTPDFETFRIGAGLGVRYQTGFGPIRVDVGVPLNPGPDDSPVAVYVSLGQAF